MDVMMRLQNLLDERGWSEYRLSKECGMSQSTIGNILRRNAGPSLDSLDRICSSLGITLSQFFAENDMVELTPDLKTIFESWVVLSPPQKEAVLQMIKALKQEQ